MLGDQELTLSTTPTPTNMSLQFFLANAFASTPHGGNQASVVLLPKGDKRASDEAWMSAVAKDFELPMTAFCEEIEPAKGEYSMRWFTPAGLVSRRRPRR